MKFYRNAFLFFLVLNFLVLTGFTTAPVTKDNDQELTSLKINYNEYLQFINQLKISNTQSDEILGAFVPGKFSYAVEQQPFGHPEYVSPKDDFLTQFSLVEAKNSYGLLAHNHLAGNDFLTLSVNDYVLIITKEETKVFQVLEIQNYQALSPQSPYSKFLSLEDDPKNYSATQLFKKIYEQEDQLVLQTCLAKNNELSWGRTFIIAEEIPDINITDHFTYTTAKR